jgi:hypothetical protein
VAFIPEGATWYIAEVVMEITVEDEARNVVHINFLLVRAQSPEEAYEKALRLGNEHETIYLNRDGKKVQCSFRGLRNLAVVYESLEHGAELLYEEKVGVDQETLDALIRPKESLAVFAPIERSPGPDYASAKIMREAERIIEEGNLGVKGGENG